MQTVAQIPVERVEEKIRVEANHIYVISPNESLSMRDGHIIISPINTVEERRAPVDIFFRTLAESHDGRSVAVILSGTGANGSMGIKRIKERGDAAFVQNPNEAEFGEMPRNSIATELVDEVLNVAEIPAKVIAYQKNLGKIVIPVEPESREEEQQKALREIFTSLRVRTGHDFANHNLLQYPPFSKLDLVTCRNLLIYFNQTAQERVLETFHFSLKPGGYLFLGTSESIDGAGDLYSAFNREERIFCSRQIFTAEERENNIPQKEMQRALENGSAEDERWHLRKDGSRFYVYGIMQPLKDGKLDGFVKIARDMTEKIAAEQTKRDKEMLQKLVSAQEDERKRIARDLHDELGQLLTALRSQLEAVRRMCEDKKISRELCGKVDEAQLVAKQVDKGIDFLAWELRPAALDDFGLYAALTKYVREWSHYSGITAQLLDSGLKKVRFSHEVETNLYRIAQESLNNVYKHAEAKLVEVSFDKRGDLIVLIMEDDGRGFDAEDKMNKDKGIGLIGMKERAALIGGSLEIESAPEKGTTIYVRVPIRSVVEV